MEWCQLSRRYQEWVQTSWTKRSAWPARMAPLMPGGRVQTPRMRPTADIHSFVRYTFPSHDASSSNQRSNAYLHALQVCITRYLQHQSILEARAKRMFLLAVLIPVSPSCRRGLIVGSPDPITRSLQPLTGLSTKVWGCFLLWTLALETKMAHRHRWLVHDFCKLPRCRHHNFVRTAAL